VLRISSFQAASVFWHQDIQQPFDRAFSTTRQKHGRIRSSLPGLSRLKRPLDTEAPVNLYTVIYGKRRSKSHDTCQPADQIQGCWKRLASFA